MRASGTTWSRQRTRGGEPAQTIEAKATVARVNGRAPRFRLQKIHLLDVGAALLAGRAVGGNFIRRVGANLVRQTDLDDVTGAGAFNQALSALGNEAAHGLAGPFSSPFF